MSESKIENGVIVEFGADNMDHGEHVWHEDATVQENFAIVRRICTVCGRVERKTSYDSGEEVWLYIGKSTLLNKHAVRI